MTDDWHGILLTLKKCRHLNSKNSWHWCLSGLIRTCWLIVMTGSHRWEAGLLVRCIHRCKPGQISVPRVPWCCYVAGWHSRLFCKPSHDRSKNWYRIRISPEYFSEASSIALPSHHGTPFYSMPDAHLHSAEMTTRVMRLSLCKRPDFASGCCSPNHRRLYGWLSVGRDDRHGVGW